jgi:hypothetical protein
MSRRKSWKRLKRTGVALALGITGCGVAHNEPAASAVTPAPDLTQTRAAPSGPTDAQVDASIEDSLTRINALQLFSVEGLVLNLPAQARECYNLPCPNDAASWAAYHAERARQAPRLAKLAEQAEICNSGNCYISTPTSADEAVQALNALQIVTIGELIQTQPANNPECYNLPCPSDTAAAEIENNRRLQVAFTTAQYGKQNGI